MTPERRLRVGVYLLFAGGVLALISAALPPLLAGGSPSRANVLAIYALLGGLSLVAAGFVSLRVPQPVLTVVLSVLGLLLVTWAAMGAFVAPNFARFYTGYAGVAGCTGCAPSFTRPELTGYAALGWTALVAAVVAVAGFWVFYRARRRLGGK
ncbi:MAG TPA: hypothetical protein VK131_05505 [Candidatus Acidoferrales bacterium]|nr:hypothetical protein [Candidatus Acidoferrales bacterium]